MTDIFNENIGKGHGEWAGERRHFLMECKPAVWKELVESGEVDSYLEEYQERYSERFQDLYNRIMEERGHIDNRGVDFMENVQRTTQDWYDARDFCLQEIRS